MAEIFLKEESYRIIGLCMEVHRTWGMGFKEATYQEALELELLEAGIPYQRELRFKIQYKERILKNFYVADFVVFDSIVLEIKTSSSIIDPHLYQVISYLKASSIKLGMIINFGTPSLQFKRVIF